jgi:uncharacterized protein with PIN domain
MSSRPGSSEACSASFRLYGQLNDFIAPPGRESRFTYPFAASETIKHAIEALGVPHTEVDVITCDGRPVEFGHRLAAGEHYDVYPWSASLARAGLPSLRPPLAETLRFLADAHLGALARLLRLAGFDTLYENNYQDDRIEAIAIEQNRVVLTRDRELLKRRGIIHGAYVYSLDPVGQFREVIERFELAHKVRRFSLCLACNAPLRTVDKADVLQRLPPRVQASQHEFSFCEICQGVFWKGSHWRRMDDLLSEVLQTAAPLPKNLSRIQR